MFDLIVGFIAGSTLGICVGCIVVFNKITRAEEEEEGGRAPEPECIQFKGGELQHYSQELTLAREALARDLTVDFERLNRDIKKLQEEDAAMRAALGILPEIQQQRFMI